MPFVDFERSYENSILLSEWPDSELANSQQWLLNPCTTPKILAILSEHLASIKSQSIHD